MSIRMRAFHEVRGYRTDLKIWHGDYQGIHFLAHWHTEIELIFIRNGDAEVHAGGATFLVHSGDLVICDSNDIHYYDGREHASKMEFLIFDPSLLSSHYITPGFQSPVISADVMRDSGLSDRW